MNNFAKAMNEQVNSKSIKTLSNILAETLKRNYNKIKGEGSASLIEYLNKIHKIELNWSDILQHTLSTYLDKAMSKRWNYPNIYYRSIRYLPSDDVEERINNITVFVDTSGSMSTEELEIIFGIILDLIEKNDIRTITVVQHDYDITKINVFEREDINDEKSFIEKIKIYGRGGTSHIRPWEQFIEKIESEEVPMPDFIIFMSDFYSDFEELYPKIREEYDFFCITCGVYPKNVEKSLCLKIN